MSRKGIVHVCTITSEQIFDMRKPRYNGFACGHGIHSDRSKYDRKRARRELRRRIAEGL